MSDNNHRPPDPLRPLPTPREREAYYCDWCKAPAQYLFDKSLLRNERGVHACPTHRANGEAEWRRRRSLPPDRLL